MFVLPVLASHCFFALLCLLRCFSFLLTASLLFLVFCACVAFPCFSSLPCESSFFPCFCCFLSLLSCLVVFPAVFRGCFSLFIFSKKASPMLGFSLSETKQALSWTEDGRGRGLWMDREGRDTGGGWKERGARRRRVGVDGAGEADEWRLCQWCQVIYINYALQAAPRHTPKTGTPQRTTLFGGPEQQQRR